MWKKKDILKSKIYKVLSSMHKQISYKQSGKYLQKRALGVLLVF